MEKKFIFACGLPRSGSTLFLNILAQNPNIHVTATSPLPEILKPIKDGFSQIESVKAMRQEDADNLLLSVLNGVLYSSFESIEKQVIVIKSRSWLSMVETLITLVGKPNLLVFVRNPAEILSSFELLHRKTRGLGITSQERNFPGEFQTIDGRVNIWIRGDQVFGSSYNMLKNAVDCGYNSFMNIVEFETLTKSPDSTLEWFYNWAKLEQFEHNFNNVEQVIFEDDYNAYGFRNLHDIRKEIRPIKRRAKEVLGDKLTNQLSGLLQNII